MSVPTITGSRKGLLFTLTAVIAMVSGGCIYLFLRPGTFIYHHWLENLGLQISPVEAGRLPQCIVLPKWFLYSLPDGLWAFAYALLIIGIWMRSGFRARWFWYASVPLLGLGFEMLQTSHLISGTFSMLDRAFCCTGIILGAIPGFFNDIKRSRNGK